MVNGIGSYALTAVLAIYQEAEGKMVSTGMFGMQRMHSNAFYVEVHGVQSDPVGRVLLGPGRPLTVRAARSLATALGKETVAEDMGLLPDGVLAMRPDGGLIWWTPAERRTLAKEGWPESKVWFPPLVFMLKSNLSVFALARDERPGEKARLYQAPLWNVGDGGWVCMGSGRTTDHGTARQRVEAVERSFFGTPFSHELGGDNVRSGDLDAVWKAIRGTRRKFPVKELVPVKTVKTLGDLVRKEGF